MRFPGRRHRSPRRSGMPALPWCPIATTCARLVTSLPKRRCWDFLAGRTRQEESMAPYTEHPRTLLHPGFVGAGSALLISGFVTDIMYYRTALMQWANFSAWLIVFGLAMALVAAVLLLLDFLLRRAGRMNCFHFILVTVAALLSILN